MKKFLVLFLNEKTNYTFDKRTVLVQEVRFLFFIFKLKNKWYTNALVSTNFAITVNIPNHSGFCILLEPYSR